MIRVCARAPCKERKRDFMALGTCEPEVVEFLIEDLIGLLITPVCPVTKQSFKREDIEITMESVHDY